MVVFKRIADLRIDNDLTQIELAKKLGVKSDTYSKWERGINIIPLESLLKLSILYNVSLDYILGTSNIKEKTLVKTINYKIICNNIKSLREKYSYTQEYVSNNINISQRNYSNYESGKRKIKTDTLYRISLFYGISFDWICYNK